MIMTIPATMMIMTIPATMKMIFPTMMTMMMIIIFQPEQEVVFETYLPLLLTSN